MREIKPIKAKNKKGKWIYGYGVILNTLLTGFSIDDYGNTSGILEEIDPKTIERYTGLKKIYEGDIVKFSYETRQKGKNGEWQKEVEIKEVQWGEYSDGEYVDYVECWMFGETPLSELLGRIRNNESFNNLWEERNINIEVVGNVHDNPELLGAK